MRRSGVGSLELRVFPSCGRASAAVPCEHPRTMLARPVSSGSRREFLRDLLPFRGGPDRHDFRRLDAGPGLALDREAGITARPRAGHSTLGSPGERASYWDSALLAFLFTIGGLCRNRSIAVDASALPAGVRTLFELASAAPAHAAASTRRPSFLARIGTAALQEGRALLRATRFLGEAIIAFGLFVRGRARYRPTDLFLDHPGMRRAGAADRVRSSPCSSA